MTELKYEDENGDPVPVEETPGYVGNVFDGEFMPGEELRVLGDFDWTTYATMADELGKTERKLKIELPKGQIEIRADAWDLDQIIEQLPAIEALYDCPPDQGPAAGSGYVFIVGDGWEAKDVEAQSAALRQALDKDLKGLELEYNKY